jgi:hypothetical protein
MVKDQAKLSERGSGKCFWEKEWIVWRIREQKKIRKSLANEFIYNQSFDIIYKWPK